MSLSANEMRWLTHAVNIAQDATHFQWRVGAIIVKSGRVLGHGTNKYRNHPSRVDRRGVSFHAEEVAMKRSGNIEGSTIYVGRITRSGTIGRALPCSRCQMELELNGVNTVIWTEPNGWGKAKISDLLNGKHGARTEHKSEKHPLLSR